MASAIGNLRVSLGSAILLGLRDGYLPAPPTTAYIMIGDHCLNNCAFCTQARDADSSGELLSRVTWPTFEYNEVLDSLKRWGGKFGRICLQCLNDPEVLGFLPDVVEDMKEASSIPISVSVGPMGKEGMGRLRKAGVERIGIALDGGSREIFDLVKGECVGNPNTYERTWSALEDAVEIFGRGNVSTHLIIGLGETDSDVSDTLLKARRMGVIVSLFAYTPMKGTFFEGSPPPLGRYRALQLLRNLVIETGTIDGFRFDDSGKISGFDRGLLLGLDGIMDSFRTRGCPDCNRPYYNERPTGPIYNHPIEIGEKIVMEGIVLAEKYSFE